MSDFTAGFAVRHAVPAPRLADLLGPRDGFAMRDPGRVRPRHFAPADRSERPTEGWDPMSVEVGATTIDPIAAAHAAGYEEGIAAAAAAAMEVARRDETLVAGITAALVQRVDRDALAGRLRQTVLHLVTRLVGEVGISAELIGGRIEAATELLADKTESALLRLHPDDVALVEGRLPATVFAVGDPHVERGSFVMESASTIVEDGPALWLDQLAGAIDKVPVPGAC
jgi:flagellar assembly protein FliH